MTRSHFSNESTSIPLQPPPQVTVRFPGNCADVTRSPYKVERRWKHVLPHHSPSGVEKPHTESSKECKLLLPTTSDKFEKAQIYRIIQNKQQTMNTSTCATFEELTYYFCLCHLQTNIDNSLYSVRVRRLRLRKTKLALLR